MTYLSMAEAQHSAFNGSPTVTQAEAGGSGFSKKERLYSESKLSELNSQKYHSFWNNKTHLHTKMIEILKRLKFKLRSFAAMLDAKKFHPTRRYHYTSGLFTVPIHRYKKDDFIWGKMAERW